ncbi:MAG: hypothetical protein JKY71_01955 [Alphaproteobacteria bacterium]|nr:hypothetical protein [Alphaproteobacteria bacterium]
MPEKQEKIVTLSRISLLALSVFAMVGVLATSSHVDAAYVKKKKQQAQPTESQPSSTATSFAQRIAQACVSGKWEQQPCLKAVSENNLVMASNYIAALDEAGKKQQGEMVKQKCAASTAATKGEYPANAMRSAYVECVNHVVDTVKATGMLPDQSQYQLLVGAVQCLDKATACSAIEQGLSRYK